ncbi:YdeI/OmpD-associated family protein [Plantibacter sp. Mn2098]|uniref:YdeI/OmpD-associated family protein n=1 Tax=Plantibacter sp. Mn2098 TaxID=3395266 RepID=UPI003BC69599
MGRHADVESGPLAASERVVRLRPDAEQTIDDAGRLGVFRSLPNSAQRELAHWVDTADEDERESRVERLIEILGEQATKRVAEDPDTD